MSIRVGALGSEFGWVVAGQAAAAVGSLVGVRLMTQFLAPVDYGVLALAMTLASLAQQTVLLPLSGAALRFFGPALEAGELRPFWVAVRRLTVRSALAIAMAGVVLIAVLRWIGWSRWTGLTFAALLFATFFGLSGILDAMQNAARQRAVVALHDGLGAWLRFLLAVILISLLGPSSTVAMGGYALAALLVLVSQYAFFRGRLLKLAASELPSAPTREASWARQLIAYAWPFATWGVFSWGQSASDRWALEASASVTDVGLYSALYQLGYYPIVLASGLLSQLAAPVLFKRAGDGTDPQRLREASRWNHWIALLAAAGTGLAALIAFVGHRWVFSLLVAPAYRGVSYLLPWMILAGGLFATGQLVVLSLLAGTTTSKLIAPKIVTALFGIGLNIVGAYWFGLVGVVAANVLLSCFYCAWVALQARMLGRGLAMSVAGPEA